MDKIVLKNVKVYGYHGVLPEEQIEGQYFYIDVEMYLDLRTAGNTDHLEETVDYSRVYGKIINTTKNNKFRLIEKLAEEISREILLENDKVNEIVVFVRKPHAPIDGEFDWMGVEIRRSRHDL